MVRRKSPRKSVERESTVEPVEDEHQQEEEEGNLLAAIATPEPPVKKRRGRPPSKHKQQGSPKVVEAKKMVVQKQDEFETDEDDYNVVDQEGETKVDRNGYLQDGREYLCTTFTLPGRHASRLYMYAFDVSKLLGFRDAYIFFNRNQAVRRINGTEEDREHLRILNLLPTQLRTRGLAFVTARNVFRVFGHRVVRRGKPSKDDYFSEGTQPFVATFDDPLVNVTIDEDYPEATGGPFGPNAASIPVLGFSRTEDDELDAFEPAFVPVELSADTWMLKCALSAAEFNQRLNKARPTRFFDLHTNVEQVPLITQPTHVYVELRTDSQQQGLQIEEHPVAKRTTDPADSRWTVVSDTHRYPIALLAGQYQDSIPLHRERFNDADFVFEALERVVTAATLGDEADDKTVALVNNVVPFKPSVSASTVQTYSKKRGRPKANRDEMETDEEKSVCVYCHSRVCAELSSQCPPSLMLQCAGCTSKQHPACTEFEDPVLVAKVMTYDWKCSNCKLCSVCLVAKDDDKLMFCDLCDRGYHTYCLQPPLNKIPSGSWLCRSCAVCQSCLKRPNSQEGTEEHWRHIIVPSRTNTLGTYCCTYCQDCNLHFSANRFCPLCLGVYEEDADDLAMVCCDVCERWVHAGCDAELTQDVYERLIEEEDAAFTCSLCDESKRNSLLARRVDDGLRFKTAEYQQKLLICPPLVKKQ